MENLEQLYELLKSDQYELAFALAEGKGVHRSELILMLQSLIEKEEEPFIIQIGSSLDFNYYKDYYIIHNSTYSKYYRRSIKYDLEKALGKFVKLIKHHYKNESKSSNK